VVCLSRSSTHEQQALICSAHSPESARRSRTASTSRSDRGGRLACVDARRLPRPPGGAAGEATRTGTVAATVAAEPTRALPDEARAPTAAGAAPRAGARRALRWLGGPAVVGAAAAVAAVVPLLAAIILAVVLVLVAVALRLARSTAPAGARPLLPAWSFALAAPVAIGVGVAQLVGPVGGAVAVLVLLVVFLLLGGELG